MVLQVAGRLISAAGGDLSGSYPDPTVAKLQGYPVSSAAPSVGQVLKWNGSAWAPATDEIGGGGFWSASGSHIYNNNAGNVGIGTSSPTHRLTVQSSDQATLRLIGPGAFGSQARLRVPAARSRGLGKSPHQIVVPLYYPSDIFPCTSEGV